MTWSGILMKEIAEILLQFGVFYKTRNNEIRRTFFPIRSRIIGTPTIRPFLYEDDSSKDIEFDSAHWFPFNASELPPQPQP